ncbi:hypothetical protein RhiirA5_409795 [Rhizophagus irregularis]|uniref:Uncharacterized protein n=1 Tax=Rhizophagus irregularis TaxID=588596 RepID=A0A2I1E642_9GLOM|nr:hypothetical protein RhiirA5_409795 [Rhizophagus irregularis]PKC73282.1 hypothetical protein RhiirA1_451326 [Rhizophagus irregularis]PKY17598.1 hypothetical protein RhiirB3_430250 [Rhizophagus irregularis]
MKKLRVKKAVYLKDRTIFDFIIHPSNDESEVIKSSLLDISKLKVKIYNNTNSKTDQAEFKLVEELLRKASIKGFNLSYPLESSPNVFSLKRMSQLYCLLCEYIIQYKKFYSFHCYRAN